MPEEARTLVFNHCLFENGRKVQMHAFVVMPTHVHLLFSPLESDKGELYLLAEIMNGIKGASSHSVNKLLKRRGRLWEPESFDRVPRSEADFEYCVLYIVENPITAGLAKGPDDYPWAWREFAQPSGCLFCQGQKVCGKDGGKAALENAVRFPLSPNPAATAIPLKQPKLQS
ncbi:MAG TPA: transposase, partial [Candidatus Angelobacter sp.]|nr:transposase [Candidatus Angelobacter sp.]